MKDFFDVLCEYKQERLRNELRELEITWLKSLTEIMNWDYEKLKSELNSNKTLDKIIDDGQFEEYKKQLEWWIDVTKEDQEYLRELLKDVVPY